MSYNVRYDSRSRFVNEDENQRKSYHLKNNHGKNHVNDFYQSGQGQVVHSHQGNNRSRKLIDGSYPPHLQSCFEGH